MYPNQVFQFATPSIKHFSDTFFGISSKLVSFPIVFQNFSVLSNSHQVSPFHMWNKRNERIEITKCTNKISQKSYCQNTVKSLIPHQILTFLEAIM